MSREPSEQDYEWAASVRGEKPPEEPELVQRDTDEEDEEGGMDGLGYDPETGEYDDEHEEPEPEPPVARKERVQQYQDPRQLALYEEWAAAVTEAGFVGDEESVMLAWSLSDPATRGPSPHYPEARVLAEVSVIEGRLRVARVNLDEYVAMSAPPDWIAMAREIVAALEADLASARGVVPVAPRPRGRRSKHSDARRGQFTGLYNSWRNMVQRCTNPRATGYEYYGARGIGFDPRWWDYAAFKADMGPTWRSGRSLDRVDNGLGYSKENCRWATPYRQTHNRGVKEPRTS